MNEYKSVKCPDRSSPALVIVLAIKALTLSEQYLADHFPRFPVMPGVLMLEAMTQAGAWLIRYTDDFADSMVLLNEARNVRYGNWVLPGEKLTMTLDMHKREGRCTHFKAKGVAKDQSILTARLVLEHFNLADDDPTQDSADEYLRQNLRQEFKTLLTKWEVRQHAAK